MGDDRDPIETHQAIKLNRIDADFNRLLKRLARIFKGFDAGSAVGDYFHRVKLTEADTDCNEPVRATRLGQGVRFKDRVNGTWQGLI